MPSVRPYAPADRPAVGAVCVATSDAAVAGRCPDPELLPAVFAYPYVDLEPGLPGVHLEVGGHNTGAIAFYERLGFHHVAPTSYGSRLMGRTP